MVFVQVNVSENNIIKLEIIKAKNRLKSKAQAINHILENINISNIEVESKPQ